MSGGETGVIIPGDGPGDVFCMRPHFSGGGEAEAGDFRRRAEEIKKKV